MLKSNLLPDKTPILGDSAKPQIMFNADISSNSVFLQYLCMATMVWLKLGYDRNELVCTKCAPPCLRVKVFILVPNGHTQRQATFGQTRLNGIHGVEVICTLKKVAV